MIVPWGRRVRCAPRPSGHWGAQSDWYFLDLRVALRRRFRLWRLTYSYSISGDGGLLCKRDLDKWIACVCCSPRLVATKKWTARREGMLDGTHPRDSKVTPVTNWIFLGLLPPDLLLTRHASSSSFTKSDNARIPCRVCDFAERFVEYEPDRGEQLQVQEDLL